MFAKNPMDPLRVITFMSFIKNYQFCDFSTPKHFVGVNGILYMNEDCWSVFQVVHMDEDCMTAFLRIFEETIE